MGTGTGTRNIKALTQARCTICEQIFQPNELKTNTHDFF